MMSNDVDRRDVGAYRRAKVCERRANRALAIGDTAFQLSTALVVIGGHQ
jgi:hypothetical protein